MGQKKQKKPKWKKPFNYLLYAALVREGLDFLNGNVSPDRSTKPKRAYTRSKQLATRIVGFDPFDDLATARGGPSTFSFVPVTRMQGGARWVVYLRRDYKTRPPVEKLATDRVFRRCCKSGQRCTSNSHRENCAICWSAEHIPVRKGWTLRIRETADLENTRIVDAHGAHPRGHRGTSSVGLDFEQRQMYKLTSTQAAYKGFHQQWPKPRRS